MATLRDRVRRGTTRVAERTGVVGSARQVEQLRRRVATLEDEVQECRRLSLRVAELTDVVTELLLPAAAHDEAQVAEVLERYRRGL